MKRSVYSEDCLRDAFAKRLRQENRPYTPGVLRFGAGALTQYSLFKYPSFLSQTTLLNCANHELRGEFLTRQRLLGKE